METNRGHVIGVLLWLKFTHDLLLLGCLLMADRLRPLLIMDSVSSAEFMS